MWRKVLLAALFGGTWLGVAPLTPVPMPCAYAQGADKIQQAKAEFDEGSRNYREEKWELAASHFEAADEFAPTARALRMAIRARSKAGQKARAATLAAQAKLRYPDDPPTSELVDETLADADSTLHKLELTCASACIVAVGKRAVPGGERENWTIFLEPGERKLSVSFGNGTDVSKKIEAEAGGTTELTLETPPDPAPVPDPVPDPAPQPNPVEPDPGDPDPNETPDEDGGGISPAFFAVGMVVTAGLGGTLVWSGIDTLNSPGTEVVERECVGQGTDCEEYQDGLAKQTRTNVFIGATAGAALVTVLFAIFTDWDGDPDETEESAITIAPSVGGWSGDPSGVILQGRF